MSSTQGRVVAGAEWEEGADTGMLGWRSPILRAEQHPCTSAGQRTRRRHQNAGMNSDDDGSQQILPPSFLALYLSPGRTRPNAPRAEIADRYEYCEDLATALMDMADNQRWSLGVNEEAVLERVWRGLAEGEAVANRAEARWVVLRLAELLNWPAWHPPAEAAAAESGPT
jgi:hypothetical protein